MFQAHLLYWLGYSFRYNLPFSFHECSSSVAIEHRCPGSSLDGLVIQNDGLGTLVHLKVTIGFLLDHLHCRGNRFGTDGGFQPVITCMIQLKNLLQSNLCNKLYVYHWLRYSSHITWVNFQFNEPREKSLAMVLSFSYWNFDEMLLFFKTEAL